MHGQPIMDCLPCELLAEGYSPENPLVLKAIKLTDALRWYAKEETYVGDCRALIEDDNGACARGALGIE